MMKVAFLLVIVALVAASASAATAECPKDGFWKDPAKCPVPSIKEKVHPHRGNQVCCPANKNIEHCKHYHYAGKDPVTGDDRDPEFKYCFGASGQNCDGAPGQEALLTEVQKFVRKGVELAEYLKKTMNIDTGDLKKNSQTLADGVGTLMPQKGEHEVGQWKHRVATSVGSIYHDSCCLAYPDGINCNHHNDDILDIVPGKDKNACHCVKEWRKAVFSVVSGRYWYTGYTEKEKTTKSDLTPTGKHLPPTSLPLSGDGPKSWDTPASHYGYAEVKSTAVLRAPAGTKLDCPAVDPRCVVKEHAAGVVAGDSVFCKSGKFRSIHHDNGPITTLNMYGVCA